MTPSPLTNRNGTVRFVVCNQKKNKNHPRKSFVKINEASVAFFYRPFRWLAHIGHCKYEHTFKGDPFFIWSVVNYCLGQR